MSRLIARLLSGLGRELEQTFRSLRKTYFRRYFVGQLTSLVGSQMNAVALSWTIFAITDSALKLGLVTFATFLPATLLGFVGGVIADRFDVRRVLIRTSLLQAGLSLTIAYFAFAGELSFPLILALGVISGVITAIEAPCRQTLVFDVVGSADLVNAVGLNALVWNGSRIVGPALAALLLSWGGTSICFLLDGLSFFVAAATIRSIRILPRSKETQSSRISYFDGLRLILRSPELLSVAALVGVLTCFAFQYSIFMPAYVARVLKAGPACVGLLVSAAALGSLLGNLAIASRGRLELLRKIIKLVSPFPGISLLCFALASSAAQAAVALFFLGCSLALLLGSANSLFQLSAAAESRGRLMSVYTSVMIGATPVGSLVLGRFADGAGISLTLVCGAVACIIASLLYRFRENAERAV